MTVEEKDKQLLAKNEQEETKQQSDNQGRQMVTSEQVGDDNPSVTDEDIKLMKTEYMKYHYDDVFIDPHTGKVYTLLRPDGKHFAPYTVKKELGPNGKFRAVWYSTGEVCGNQSRIIIAIQDKMKRDVIINTGG